MPGLRAILSDVDRVVVIGAGFAGLSAVRHLRDQPVEVTVVDHHNFHTFQPLLYQVATAGLDPADVAYPVRTIFGRDHNVVFRHGQAASVDLDGAARGPRRRRGPSTTTTSSSPPAPPPGSSACRARRNTRCRSTPWPTPATCGTTSSAASRRPTPGPRTSTAGRRPSWWWAGVPPGWRSRARWWSCSTWRSGATACASTPSAPGSSSSRRATGSCPGSRSRPVATPPETLRSRRVDVRLATPVAEVTADGGADSATASGSAPPR